MFFNLNFMARPKYSEESLRKKYIKINLNEKEKALIDELFKNSNYSYVADMVRDILLNNKYSIVTNDNEMFQIRSELLNEVRRVGNNFNQLLKHFNQKKSENFTQDDIENMIFLLSEIKLKFNQINENFKL